MVEEKIEENPFLSLMLSSPTSQQVNRPVEDHHASVASPHNLDKDEDEYADVDPKLRPLLPKNVFFIEKGRVEDIMREMGYASPLDLLREVLKLAARRARPPISRYFVGAAGLSRAGHIYCGVNVEFGGLALNDAIHAEQCLVARLLNSTDEGGGGLVAFSVNAPPCGHCRQFLNELDSDGMEIHIEGRGTFGLRRDLLPFSFGPDDLLNSTRLLRHPPYAIALAEGEPESPEADPRLVELAIAAASRAYTPYTECPSGKPFPLMVRRMRACARLLSSSLSCACVRSQAWRCG